jgi:hypothetical protein
MGGIDVGGDTSVMWKVDGDNVRKGKVKSDPVGNKGHHQEGIDETDTDQYFTIFLEIPSGAVQKSNLGAALQAAANAVTNSPAGSGIKVSIPLPIEPQNEDQIQIRWNSKP